MTDERSDLAALARQAVAETPVGESARKLKAIKRLRDMARHERGSLRALAEAIDKALAEEASSPIRDRAIEAAARALAADRGLDLDNLAASKDSGDTAEDLAAWRANWLDDGRVAYEAMAPIVLAEIERLQGELTRFEGNAEILSASTVGEAFDRIEQTIRERDEARAELAKAREALLDAQLTIEAREAAIKASDEMLRIARQIVTGADAGRPCGDQPAPAAVETPDRVSTVAMLGLAEAAASVALDGDTFTVDEPAVSGVVARGPDEIPEDEGEEVTS